MDLYATQKELSLLINLTPKRIRELRQTEGIFIPDNKTKKYNLPVCIKEFINYRIQTESPSGNADYEKERAEHEQAKKEITKLKLRRLKREMHEAGAVEAVVGDMIIRFRSKLLSVPQKLAPQLIGINTVGDIVGLLKQEMYEALSELSDYNAVDYISDEDYEEDDYEKQPEENGASH